MNTALINKEAYKYGIINGLIGILVLYGTWAAGMKPFFWAQLYGTVIPYMIILLIIGGFQLRKANGGYLSFKEGLRFSFLSYVISAVMIAIATYILYNLIDPALTQKSFEIGLEQSQKMLEKMHASEEVIEKTLADAQKKQSETSVKTIFLGLGLELIVCFVKSLIVTLFIRKEKPVSFEL
ncbi:DUF4199 domain-containing protein [Filimonas effusa]|uniref:DUF4199 domain-containing protein n=1 Tax=Filimonas effusa TaxID=2508721 RepID=A0A4V1MAK8_9BACT|nr:DUF4199 domain-containing protein [Filimonas effusa]RXK86226.1 DUF4199 domain-containing protein [Filimonas effusa]